MFYIYINIKLFFSLKIAQWNCFIITMCYNIIVLYIYFRDVNTPRKAIYF